MELRSNPDFKSIKAENLGSLKVFAGTGVISLKILLRFLESERIVLFWPSRPTDVSDIRNDCLESIFTLHVKYFPTF